MQMQRENYEILSLDFKSLNTRLHLQILQFQTQAN